MVNDESKKQKEKANRGHPPIKHDVKFGGSPAILDRNCDAMQEMWSFQIC